MNNPYWLGIKVSMNNPHCGVSESIHSQIVHNHICEIIVSNKNISYSSMYIKIIYSVLKYIYNNPLLKISNTKEIKILTIVNNF